MGLQLNIEVNAWFQRIKESMSFTYHSTSSILPHSASVKWDSKIEHSHHYVVPELPAADRKICVSCLDKPCSIIWSSHIEYGKLQQNREETHKDQNIREHRLAAMSPKQLCSACHLHTQCRQSNESFLSRGPKEDVRDFFFFVQVTQRNWEEPAARKTNKSDTSGESVDSALTPMPIAG